MNNSTTVNIQILDESYQLRCAPSEVESLQQAALLLDAKMRDIRDVQRPSGLERTAILAGLNISHELLSAQRTQEKTTREFNQRISALLNNISDTLTQSEQMEL